MGHASSSYLIQESHFNGFYHNPFKHRQQGLKFTKWITVDGRLNLVDAKAAWLEAHAGRDQKQVQRFRVTFKGKTVIDPRGRVYEQKSDSGGYKWMAYVETLPGCEEL
jgi:hypothetical protein